MGLFLTTCFMAGTLVDSCDCLWGGRGALEPELKLESSINALGLFRSRLFVNQMNLPRATGQKIAVSSSRLRRHPQLRFGVNAAITHAYFLTTPTLLGIGFA